MIYWYFVCCALSLCLVQAEIDLLFEDGTCVFTNDKYIKPDSCGMEVEDDSEYGTSLTTRLEIVKAVDKIVALGNINAAQMGEYTNDLGLHVEMDLCDALSNPTSIAFPILRALDMAADNCPPKPGVYGRENYVIDNFDGLPDSFPPGKYLLNITLMAGEKEKPEPITQFHLYLTVV
ncbi:uncharacterized protein LOC116426424 [Nomia melanderi]|uniref:uncharacterized protein LOC116426424 n=1 Tax=Nomia melanderi TaxID=2448451 RepID=UPI001304730F|nr:uncharacterized protein LOC116426424 [Nomia melanderi]